MATLWGTTNSESGILRKNDTKDNLNDLLVFGYACKLFKDDEKALEIDQGKQLIPWMGDNLLKIDRYDGRGALSDLKPYEASKEGYDAMRWLGLSESDRKIEQLCDEERYRALHTNEEEDELYKEEELKRAQTNQVQYNYDEKEETCTDSEKPDDSAAVQAQEEEDEPFVPNPGLDIPVNMTLPKTVKENARIEKTALFISKQGPQMEILLKTKQASNPQFSFLTQDDPLYRYYRHVLMAIKTGRYQVPSEQPKVEQSEKPDDYYLHPSLAPLPLAQTCHLAPITTPTISYKPSADCAYSQLINKIKGNQSTLSSSSTTPPAPTSVVNSSSNNAANTAVTLDQQQQQQQQNATVGNNQHQLYQQQHHAAAAAAYAQFYQQQYGSYWSQQQQQHPQQAQAHYEQYMQYAAAQYASAQPPAATNSTATAPVQQQQQQQQQQHSTSTKLDAQSPYAQIVSNVVKTTKYDDGKKELAATTTTTMDNGADGEIAKAPMMYGVGTNSINSSSDKMADTNTMPAKAKIPVTPYHQQPILVQPSLFSLAQYSGSESDGDNDDESSDAQAIVIPSPDIQLIIDKMASYVAKNGVDFENIVKAKGDPRFVFLEVSHLYNPYYKSKLKEFHKQKQLSDNNALATTSTSGTTVTITTTTSETTDTTGVIESSSAAAKQLKTFVNDSKDLMNDNSNSSSSSSKDIDPKDTKLSTSDDATDSKDTKSEKPPDHKKSTKFKEKKIITPVSFSIKKPATETQTVSRDKSALPVEDSTDDESSENNNNNNNNKTEEKNDDKDVANNGGAGSNNGAIVRDTKDTGKSTTAAASTDASGGGGGGVGESKDRQEKNVNIIEIEDPIMELIDLTEEMEEKRDRRAEDRVKDKLALAAREKLAAKNRALQLERKKRAAAFLSQLKPSAASKMDTDEINMKSAYGDAMLEDGEINDPSLEELPRIVYHIEQEKSPRTETGDKHQQQHQDHRRNRRSSSRQTSSYKSTTNSSGNSSHHHRHKSHKRSHSRSKKRKHEKRSRDRKRTKRHHRSRSRSRSRSSSRHRKSERSKDVANSDSERKPKKDAKHSSSKYSNSSSDTNSDN